MDRHSRFHSLTLFTLPYSGQFFSYGSGFKISTVPKRFLLPNKQAVIVWRKVSEYSLYNLEIICYLWHEVNLPKNKTVYGLKT